MTTPARPSDPPILTASLARGTFAYTDEGSGPTIVAVHGLPGSVRDFRWLGAAFDGAVRLVRLDLPGFGATPASTGSGVDIDSRGAFVVQALKALKIDRCVMLGHSMGGSVALSAAVQAPDRIAALALIASVGLTPNAILFHAPLRAALTSAISVRPLERVLRIVSKAMLKRSGFPPNTSDAAVSQTLRCITKVDFEVQRRNTERLTVPTLAAWAQDDQFIARRIMENHAAVLPAGPRLTWPEGGHNIQKSKAVELAAELLKLSSVYALGPTTN